MAEPREGRVEALLAEVTADLGGQDTSRPWLVAGSAALAEHLGTQERWTRWATEGERPLPAPPPGPWGRIAVRMPRGAEVGRMTLHLLAGVLAPDGRLVAAAANDEGGRSLRARMEEIFSEVGPSVAGHHARAVEAAVPGSPRARLEDWQENVEIEGRTFATWPGLFAHGRLDRGTALLLSVLPPASGASVLDVGCGIGVLADALLRRGAASVELVDVDALAIYAAQLNVPQGRAFCADTLPPGATTYDLVVSNPPLHRGSDVDWSVLSRLASDLPERMRKGGEVWLVTQVTVPIRKLFAGFSQVEQRASDGSFTVWKLIAPVS
jgi:16S rRNA (guanine1207-N2)-methyltransferase